MPTYTYRREDGSTFEVEQRITADPLETCPTTGQPVKRIITSGAGLVFKGGGFYLTDYSRGASATSSESGSSDAAGTLESDKTATKSSESATGNGKSGESKSKEPPKASSAGSSSD